MSKGNPITLLRELLDEGYLRCAVTGKTAPRPECECTGCEMARRVKDTIWSWEAP